MAKLNPFNPNSVVVPDLFAGRAEQVNDICKKLSLLKHLMPTSFFIHGERGIGKTALAKLILYIASLNDKKSHDLNLLTSYYAVEKGQDISSVLEESVNKLTNQMTTNLIDKIASRVGNLIKNGKFQIGAYGASASFEAKTKIQQAITIKDQTVAILSNIINSLEDDENADKQNGILIVIDEIHNLSNLSSVASIIRNIVTTLDVERLGKVSFLLVGYEEDVEKFFSEDSSARRTFDLIKLNTMPDNDAAELLRKGFKIAEYKYDNKAIKKNISVVGGYPHSIQIIGHQLIEVDEDDYINQADWDKASIEAAFILRDKEFANMYSFEKTGTSKDKILVLLANENKAMNRKEIAENLPKIKNIYQYFPQLKKSGAIKENGKKALYLHSQLFRTSILMDTIMMNIKETILGMKKRIKK